jgi:hypothetical protein
MIPALATILPSLAAKAFDMFDRKFQSDAEKEQAKRDFAIAAQAEIESAWAAEQEQLSRRHQNDMVSDSWLSKNVRPLVLVYLMGLFSIAFTVDVPPTVLEMLRDLLMTVFVFYFGSRTLEKMANIWKK